MNFDSHISYGILINLDFLSYYNLTIKPNLSLLIIIYIPKVSRTYPYPYLLQFCI